MPTEPVDDFPVKTDEPCPVCPNPLALHTHSGTLDCLRKAGRQRAEGEKAATDRALTIIRANVPHDGYCSMDDCTGCQIVYELTKLIEASK
jgi:hypothetical protein